MKNYLLHLLCLLCIFTISHLALAQDEKKEYEEKIDESEIPETIKELLSPMMEDARRIKYFREYDENHSGYEIEMVWEGKKLSIEFYDDGRLMDIEELISHKEIEDEAREAIDEYMDDTYKRHRMLRIQRQYTAEEEDDEDEDEEIIEDFMEGDTDDLTIRYEIVAQVKGEEKYGPYEFLFDDEGNTLKVQRIDRRSSDNVLY
ncbi:hypothetical protein PZB74_13650 [Porifericola rhodea]|uniref:hypothetical protein n=1 Tax=Porifericola rhodea TaxID=930972 RepID=UPI002667145A|nr:hypothetical protein [Porifericola rhodea]WKN30010.1 hypothetical protein PZB74_13650 [Porifericola rhodea]